MTDPAVAADLASRHRVAIAGVEERAVFARAGSRSWLMTAVVMDPALRSNFSADESGTLMTAIAAALHNVYLVTGLLVLVGSAATRALPRGLSPTNAARER